MQGTESRKPLMRKKLSSTGFSSRELKSISNKVSSLGGELLEVFSSDMFCLIVKRVGSTKYHKAVELGIPCVQMEWIAECEAADMIVSFQPYLAKTFTGLQISLTGFLPEDRSHLVSVVTTNGGEISKVMSADSCTHLIAAKADGEKYRHAIKWEKTHVVSRSWVEECILAQRCLDESTYIFTATDSVREVPIVRAGICDKHKIFSLGPHDLPAASAVDISKRAVFRSEIFYISGFDPAMRDYLLCLIIAGGGRRHHILTIDVTKILFGDGVSEKLVIEARRHPAGAECVTTLWVLSMLGLVSQP